MKKAILIGGLVVIIILCVGANNKKVEKAATVLIMPIWQIFQEGTDKSVEWQDHKPNPRFTIYDAGTPTDNTDDLVLDKETGLVWERNPSGGPMEWGDIFYYCYGKSLGSRMGWRMPTVEEMASLVNPNQGLPFGHPFTNVQGWGYWTSTPYNIEIAFYVEAQGGTLGDDFMYDSHLVWCVRGGQGNKQ